MPHKRSSSPKLATMDVPRPDLAHKRRRQHLLFALVFLGVVALITLALAKLKPALPRVDRSTLLLDTVRLGELLREVRGSGTLVPEEIRWIPTVNAGRVEQILVLPGARVKSTTVIVELSNPEVEQVLVDAEAQLKGAEADLANLRVQLDSQKLTQEKAVATAEADYSGAKLDLEVNEELVKVGLIPSITLKQSKAKAGELVKLLTIEQRRLDIGVEAAKAQLESQHTKITQLQAQLELKRRHVAALTIRAGMDGVLQRLGDPSNPLQVGQQLSAGTVVALVANPTRLKAAIKIAETQAKDVQLDQVVAIDTRNGFVRGHVVRVDPAVEKGTVTVDVALDGAYPKGARPDLSVDGTIELERLERVLYVGRPVQAQPNSLTGLFRIDSSGRIASRVQVRMGRTSLSTIEILDGLHVDDQIILSDMSQWDAYDRVRLN